MSSLNIAPTITEELAARMKEARATNTAALAMGLGLAGMTWDRWQLLTPAQKDALRDNSALTSQLKGFEGCRVEVIDNYGERRRFWVRKSTGWQPVHIECKLINSSGGTSADRSYQSVKIVTTPKSWRDTR